MMVLLFDLCRQIWTEGPPTPAWEWDDPEVCCSTPAFLCLLCKTFGCTVCTLLSWRAPEGPGRLYRHVFIHVKSMCGVYMSAWGKLVCFIISWRSDSTCYFPFCNDQTPKLHSWKDLWLWSLYSKQNKSNPRNPEKAGRIRSLTLWTEKARIHMICQELNGRPRVCLYRNLPQCCGLDMFPSSPTHVFLS